VEIGRRRVPACAARPGGCRVIPDAIAIAVLAAVAVSWVTFDTWYGFLRRLPSRLRHHRKRRRLMRGPVPLDGSLADWELRAWLAIRAHLEGRAAEAGHPALRRRGGMR